MRNFLFSLFAICVATVAAMTATTAMLNAPVRTPPPAPVVSELAQAEPPSAVGEGAPGTGAPATPGAASSEGAPPSAAPAAAATATEEEGDKDPYEGIAPEELPPDLQYSADSSVSFPTNI